MFLQDYRPFKKEMCELIDVGDSGTPDDLRRSIEALIAEHKVRITADVFAGHIMKLVAMNNKERAKKLVAALDDHALTVGAALAVWLIGKTLKWGGLALFIGVVVWLTMRFFV